MTADLIESVFLPELGNPTLNRLDDAAVLNINGQRLAITTDSYVVNPIFFPGGDIGSLAVHGTVNDLAMSGARPLYMTASFILEEGLAIEDLRKIVRSMAKAANESGVELVAGDTKVVNHGAADKIFITTTGIGLVETSKAPSADQAQAGDCIVVSGDIGRHGMAIMCAREGLDLETVIESDSANLHPMTQAMAAAGGNIHCLRDLTRGGLASALNELSSSSNVGMEIVESNLPIHPEVRAACELLGLDPLYVACEGRFVAILPEPHVEEALASINTNAHGKDARMIGKVVADHPGRVVLKTRIGGRRIVDKLSGEQLPRIC
jgi:hydrogenase expression/formation protein HypE